MIWLILFTTIFAYLFHQLFWRRRNLPPGPIPYPLVGNIPSLDAGTLDKQFLSLKKKYGDVMTVWLPNPFIVISDSEVSSIQKCGKLDTTGVGLEKARPRTG